MPSSIRSNDSGDEVEAIRPSVRGTQSMRWISPIHRVRWSVHRREPLGRSARTLRPTGRCGEADEVRPSVHHGGPRRRLGDARRPCARSSQSGLLGGHPAGSSGRPQMDCQAVHLD
jgi:hypothetical protein